MQPEIVLKELLDAIGAPYTAVERVEVAGQIVLAISIDDGKLLIGARGDTVHALDHIVKKIIEHKNPPRDPEAAREPMFLVDVNDYRSRQIRDLQAKVLMLADRARSFQYDVELSPMSAYERLIVHTTLQDAPNLKTESQGEGRNRRVIIKYTSE